MRVLVCGGRDYADAEQVEQVLDHYLLAELAICHGAARGADTLAGQWAARRAVPCQRFPADWSRYGRAAGALRNARMLAEFTPDLVLAFPGGRGTADMVARATLAGVPVVQVPAEREAS